MKRRKTIPTKMELLQLQKLYKTDEKIGERLGGVPSYLVAYWRRKKNIARYSLPKFSEKEVLNLWERYGDDEKAGLELGISKAAFYNWRRRYGFREKPDFLKLEQLEFNFPGSKSSSLTSSLWGKRTVAQKVIAHAAGVDKVASGEEIEVEPDLVLSPGGASKIISEFVKRGIESVWNPGRLVMMLDNDISHSKNGIDSNEMALREFVRRQGIKAFYDHREGSCTQLLMEKGHILPGQLIVGNGRGNIAYGAMVAIATNISIDTVVGLWSSGKQMIKVPDTIKVIVGGRRPRGVYAADIALKIMKEIGPESVSGSVLEFVGSAVSQMTMGERFALSDIASVFNPFSAVCNYDATTRRYLTGRTMTRFEPTLPDKDAEYSDFHQIVIDELIPQIAPLDNPGANRPVVELEDRAVQRILLGGCTSGRFEDLRVAAEVLKNRKVHEDCRLTVVPGSKVVYLEALKKGLIRVFVEAGALVVHPGSYGIPQAFINHKTKSERCLTTTFFDLSESDSSKKTELYLCSPATAAVSAIYGRITDPTRFVR